MNAWVGTRWNALRRKLTRFFAEQVVTFPRFILSGGRAAARRKASLSAAPSASRS